MMLSVQIGHVITETVFSDRIVYSPEKLLYGVFVIANFIQSPFMANVVKYGRESNCSSLTKFPFSGVDMMMKAVGKDCTSLFSILFLNFPTFSGFFRSCLNISGFL